MLLNRQSFRMMEMRLGSSNLFGNYLVIKQELLVADTWGFLHLRVTSADFF
jgi:hypothetical protein